MILSILHHVFMSGKVYVTNLEDKFNEMYVCNDNNIATYAFS